MAVLRILSRSGSLWHHGDVGEIGCLVWRELIAKHHPWRSSLALMRPKTSFARKVGLARAPALVRSSILDVSKVRIAFRNLMN